MLNEIVEFINKHAVCIILLPTKTKSLEMYAGAHEVIMNENEGRPLIAIGRCNFADEAWYCQSVSYQHLMTDINEKCGTEIEIIDY